MEGDTKMRSNLLREGLKTTRSNQDILAPLAYWGRGWMINFGLDGLVQETEKRLGRFWAKSLVLSIWGIVFTFFAKLALDLALAVSNQLVAPLFLWITSATETLDVIAKIKIIVSIMMVLLLLLLAMIVYEGIKQRAKDLANASAIKPPRRPRSAKQGRK